MSQILITGGTGLVGRKLIETLDDVLITSRNAERALRSFEKESCNVLEWDFRNSIPDLRNRPLKAVVNLMGESVAEGRWTADKKKRMRDSRIVATGKLIKAISQMDDRPDVLVSASAVGYYRDSGDMSIDETGPPGDGFLAELVADWEHAAAAVEPLGVRLVILRIGVVLSTEGGALKEMLSIFRKGIGGKLGSGKQFFPWIHIDDLVNMIVWAMDNSPVQGVYNAAAPNPVTNSEFTKTLASTIRRPAILPVPKFAVKLMFGQFAETLFASQRVIPAAAMKQGFQFRHAQLQPALEDLLG